jgi:hypothetical protein
MPAIDLDRSRFPPPPSTRRRLAKERESAIATVLQIGDRIEE